jgi:hypothetical protein
MVTCAASGYYVGSGLREKNQKNYTVTDVQNPEGRKDRWGSEIAYVTEFRADSPEGVDKKLKLIQGAPVLSSQ